MTTELFKEAAVMKSFEHQNVLKLHGVTLDTVYRNEFENFMAPERHLVVIKLYLV